MVDCVFCKIIAKEILCYQIYEDELFLGFLDKFPLNPGNSLLIPKQHYRWVYDVPQIGQYWQIATKIGIASMNALEGMSVSFLTLGFEVPHAHIRIIPRFTEDKSRFENGINTKDFITLSQDEMLVIAQKIKSTL